MHCDHAHQQLNALADGELNRWQAWQIRKHLRHCPACADEFATMQQLGEQARAWRNTIAPASLHARIVHTLTEAQAEGSSLSLSNEENSTMQHAHDTVLPSSRRLNTTTKLTSAASSVTPLRYPARLNWRPIAALSGVGFALAIMGLFLLPTRKSFAFAAVVQAMQKVRTIHWVVKANSATPPDSGLEGDGELTVMEAWARLDKPACALLMGEGGEVRTLITPDKHTTIADGKVLMEMPLPLPKGEGKEKLLRSFILEQLISPSKKAAAAVENGIPDVLKDSEGNTAFQREEVIFDARPAVRFFTEQKLGEGHLAVSLWVDPDTHLILRSETRISDPTGGQPDLVTIAAQFRYNEEPPAGIFDLPKK